MGFKIYVCNLPYSTTSVHLIGIFSPFGKVNYATAVRDKITCVPRGFGFVEMETEEGRKEAIEKLNGRVISGRKLKVTEAWENTEDRRRPKGHIIGEGICALCGKLEMLAGYEQGNGICAACAKIFRNTHFFYEKALPFTEEAAIIECILEDR